MQKILDEGFKTRAQLSGINVTGGGPDNSISFTLNRKTATAIALGIYTIRGIARGEILLGDLIVQAQQVAPKALEYCIKYMATDHGIKTPEDVRRVDSGLERFTNYSTKADASKLEKLLASERTEIIAQDEWRVSGWAPVEIVASVSEHWRAGEDPAWKYHRITFDVYKTLLSIGSGEKELYDPVFFLTNLGALSRMSLDEIGILSVKILADWVCAEWRGAESLGYDPGSWTEPRLWPSVLSDWSHGCENRLRFPKEEGAPYHSTLPRGWDPPSREDTIVYLGAMSEIRVYDSKLIDNVREYASVDDVVNAARDAWDRKGLVIDQPYFMPNHREDWF
jgi:hypothetical protein